MRLAVRADVGSPEELREAVPGPVILGEPALWVDDEGNDWFVYSDPRLSPEQAGRAAAVGQGKAYQRPTYPEDRGPDFDPFAFEIGEQGQSGRRPVTVQVDAEGLRPKPIEEA